MMKTTSTFKGYIGTYTKGDSEGIYSFSLDTKAQKVSINEVAARLDNPTYLCISEDQKYVYSVIKDGDLGGVASFSIDQETKNLDLINQQLAPGSSPCHVSVSRDLRHVFSANYHKGTLDSYLVNSNDGSLQPLASTIQYEGSGPDHRQEKAHAHFAGFTPDEKYVVAIDLGSDWITTNTVDEKGKLTEVFRLDIKPGSGPRHMVFHPVQPFAFVLTELSSEVLVLKYNAEEGSFSVEQTISTIPSDFNENNQCSAIHISSDGRFIYAGNRGHNSIAVFKVGEDNLKLELVEIVSTEGDWPRDFDLDPTEEFILGSNQNTSNLVLYKRDAETGKLTVVQTDVSVPEPVCVKFLKGYL